MAAVADRVKRTVIRSLGLEIDPGELGEDEVLYGSGLGADSVATLEVVFALEAEFGIEVEDGELRVELFATVQSLVDYVERKLAASSLSG
jgi:acyl carrier protein